MAASLPRPVQRHIIGQLLQQRRLQNFIVGSSVVSIFFKLSETFSIAQVLDYLSSVYQMA
jgi:hypothetical protein